MFGDNIKYYRQLAGISQEQLANKIGVTKMAISNYENDKRDISSNMIIKIAEALGIKAYYLLSNEEPKSVITFGNFRNLKALSVNERNIVCETVKKTLYKFECVFTILGEQYAMPKFKYEKKYFIDRETSSKELRNLINIGMTGPTGNLTDRLESVGIIVIKVDVGDISFLGVNGTVNDRPFIAINKKLASEEQRFTIIHELLHIVMDFDSKNEEKEIEKITGFFLFPTEDIITELGKIRSDIRWDLRRIQRKYGIPIREILIRAKEENIITSRIYREQYIWLKENGILDDKNPISSEEESTLLKRLVIRAVSEKLIGISKACELLDISREEINQKLFEIA